MLCSAKTFSSKWQSTKIQPRIVGGRKADIKDHPWLLSFREYGQHKCGASLIKPDKALTAAHCYDIDIAARDYSVYAGSPYRSSNGELANVGRIYVHPKFDFDEMTNDIAVVWLLKNLTIGTFIQPIPLAQHDSIVPENVKGAIAGWGITMKHREWFSEDLYSARVPIVKNEDCIQAYGDKSINENVLCAGYIEGNIDACTGDSGGPLVINNVQYGIVSWGNDCGRPNYVGIYTRISSFRKWIDLAITDEYM